LTKLVDITAERGKRAVKCEHCGEEPHGGEYACPRITGIVKYPDGSVEISYDTPGILEILLDEDDEPPPAA
jgi:hypothetical protein